MQAPLVTQSLAITALACALGACGGASKGESEGAAKAEPAKAGPAVATGAADGEASDRAGSRAVKLATSRGPLASVDLGDAAALDTLQGRGVLPPPTVSILEPADGATVAPGPLRVKLDIENYEIQNSGDDRPHQHVHVILDNLPYHAHYDASGYATFDEVPPGPHVITAFLAREFHMSLKNPEAFAQVRVNVGEVPAKAGDAVVDLDAPMLVYSRPKGSYDAAKGEAESVLVDFYLRGLELSPGGNTVRASVGEQSLEFTSWSPQVFRDVPVGTHTVTLEALDSRGERIDAAWNPTTREIEIKRGE